MIKLIIGSACLMSLSAFAAGHAGLDTTLKCIPNADNYDLVKELNAISINRVNDVTNQYKSAKVSESIIAENIDLATCLNAVTDIEAKKIIKH